MGAASHRDVHTPVTILTGFLGSGKTSLLNRALRSPSMARTMIVINEFGQISLDHALSEASNDAIVVLENGCLCCTVFGDLVQTFNRLYHARETGDIDFDHVVIETSGLAEPAPVLQAFLSEPTMEGLYRVAGLIATFDAINGPETLDNHPVSVAQLALADQLLITKLDLIPATERAAVEAQLTARLRAINPTASLHAIDDPSIDAVQLMRSIAPDPSAGPASAQRWLDSALERTADAHAAGGHRHDDVATFALLRDTALPHEALQLLLASLERHLGPKLLRVKGLVCVAEDPERPAVIQGAQHLLSNLTWLARWPDADRRTRIVFITQGIEAEELGEMVGLLERVAQRTAAARQRAMAAVEGGATSEAPRTH
jgi:G3E family GTPase